MPDAAFEKDGSLPDTQFSFVPILGLSLDFEEYSCRLADGQEFAVIRRIANPPAWDQFLLRSDIKASGLPFILFQVSRVSAEFELKQLSGRQEPVSPAVAVSIVDLLHVKTGSFGATPVLCNRSLVDIARYPANSLVFAPCRGDALLHEPLGQAPIELADIEWALARLPATIKLTKEQKFRISLDALTTFHHSRYLEPRLLTLWSGIESVFGVDAEIAFRLSLLSATYLEGRGKEGYELFKDVKANYNSRSRVAHGSRVEDIEKAIGFAHTLLRRLLIRVLESGALPVESSILFPDEKAEQAGRQ